MKICTRKQFRQFVNDMETSFTAAVECERSNNLFLYVDEERKFVIIENIRTGKRGIAKCHKSDVFNERIGIAIAWAKYLGREVPVIAEEVSYNDLKEGDLFYFHTKFNEYTRLTPCEFIMITQPLTNKHLGTSFETAFMIYATMTNTTRCLRVMPFATLQTNTVYRLQSEVDL